MTEGSGTRERLRDIESRVEALETLAIRAIVLADTVLLVLGGLLPVYRELEGDAVPTLRLATGPFAVFGAMDDMEESQAFPVTMGTVLLVVLAAIAVALGVGYQQWFRLGGPSAVRVAKAAAAVLCAGAVLAVVLAAGVAGERPGEVGPGLWLFVSGTVLFTATAFGAGLRGLWRLRS